MIIISWVIFSIIIIIIVFHLFRYFLFQKYLITERKARTDLACLEIEEKKNQIEAERWKNSIQTFKASPGETLILKDNITNQICAFQGIQNIQYHPGSNELVQNTVGTQNNQIPYRGDFCQVSDNIEQKKQPKYVNVGTRFPEIEFEKPKNIIDVLSSTPRIWIVGGQESGKTTILKHLVSQYRKWERVIILDTHDHIGKWPEVQIVGKGRKYQEIKSALKWILSEIDKRYRIYSAQRNPQFETVRIVADEWTRIPGKCKDIISDFTDSFFTEGRKVGFNFCFATHSKRTKSTGFDGRNDIFEQIDAKVRLSKVKSKHKAEVDFGEGWIEYDLPGKYEEDSNDFESFESFENSLNPLEKRIIEILKNNKEVSRTELFHKFQNKITKDELDGSIQKLIEFDQAKEDMIYNGKGRPKKVYIKNN